MKRLIKLTVQAVIDVEETNELHETIDEIVRCADWDVDTYIYEDCGKVEE